MDQLNDAPGLSGPPEYVLWCEACGARIVMSGASTMKLIFKSPWPVFCNDCHATRADAVALDEEDA